MPGRVALVAEENVAAPVTPEAAVNVDVAPKAALTLSGFAAKAVRKADWSNVSVPSRVSETPAAPAPLTSDSSCCCSDRAVASPVSGPPVFVVVL